MKDVALQMTKTIVEEQEEPDTEGDDSSVVSSDISSNAPANIKHTPTFVTAPTSLDQKTLHLKPPSDCEEDSQSKGSMKRRSTKKVLPRSQSLGISSYHEKSALIKKYKNKKSKSFSIEEELSIKSKPTKKKETNDVITEKLKNGGKESQSMAAITPSNKHAFSSSKNQEPRKEGSVERQSLSRSRKKNPKQDKTSVSFNHLCLKNTFSFVTTLDEVEQLSGDDLQYYTDSDIDDDIDDEFTEYSSVFSGSSNYPPNTSDACPSCICVYR
uniref:Uncharacterized protein n=2 Tax=Corethron hystrix TaxID=216773 RepID=A0A7S1B2H6_9STRA|mmetsp:Transcript_10277/g.22807  ORF Transcript_10277/g.22807 Transcript_10277/m.22807 type:complete len:270 (+) Transcript_10277:275-1084(+)